MDLSTVWPDATFAVIDIETTGKYPLEAEICELAALKWQNGKEIGRYQTLIKPVQTMNEAVIKIHNITNEMVADAPRIGEKIGEFHAFLGDAVPVAHHAPFDMGFLAIEFEAQRLPLPTTPTLCTSLLSRAVIAESPNHRMATLVQFLGIEGGQAHRAMDDTVACLQLMLKCLERVGPTKTISEVISIQGVVLNWRDYSIANLRANRVMAEIIQALREKQPVEIVYQGGSRPGKPRTVLPLGIVRNPAGDFLVAREESDNSQRSLDEVPKRYFLNKISNARR
ncbi:MAG: exonuclease [Bdellovibrionales bacterium]|nr:exonuclease [Bdellovibrionales bacterium]